MGRASEFAALNTKIRAMESRFLNNEDYKNLLHKKNVSEVAAYLKKETHYRDVLESINENEIHRSQLETIIRKYHMREIERLYHYFHDGYKKFYSYTFIKREIEDLKSILRSIKTGSGGMMDKDSFIRAGALSGLNMDSLLASKDMGEFIRNLRGTIYYRYLRPLEDRKDENSLFEGEMALDLAYFELFYKFMNGMKKKDRKIVEVLQGINVDLLNIQWIYRGLKFYSLPREVLFNYTIRYGESLSRNDIKELCYVKDIEEFQERVLNTRYGFLFDHEKTRDIFMERRILRYQYFLIKSVNRRHEMNISQAVVFEALLEYEIRDIVTIIESIRYDMPLEEAERFLIRKL